MEKETVRMEGFSDAIFAIAITLLVLDLHMPEKNALTSSTTLINYLTAQWPSYLAFCISFFSIFIMWVNHHKLFKQIYSRNTAITFANGLILFFASVVSYPTGLLAQYFNTPSVNVVVAIYTGLFILINLSYLLLWHIASKNKTLLRPDINEAAIKKITLNYVYSLPVYIVAFGLSFTYPVVALILCICLWIYWALSSGKLEKEAA
ncbi:TMEM175 family protein [Flavobacterium psychrotrophum]|uniref:TMEM175 family protein n=1 Tax=Flavobacterium psychrotrophum TaxID=2294119 RepID=UPI000E319E68|nr:TMEM175 family protein [Flavobacterium psychrotrophum]